jgi:hypothetical protein
VYSQVFDVLLVTELVLLARKCVLPLRGKHPMGSTLYMSKSTKSSVPPPLVTASNYIIEGMVGAVEAGGGLNWV